MDCRIALTTIGLSGSVEKALAGSNESFCAGIKHFAPWPICLIVGSIGNVDCLRPTTPFSLATIVLSKMTAHFRDLRISTKLKTCFGAMVALTAIVSYQGLSRMSVLNDGSQLLFSHDLTGISAIKEAAIFQVKCTRSLRNAILAIGDKDAIEEQKEVLAEFETSVNSSLDEADKAFTDAESRRKVADVRVKLAAFDTNSQQVFQ